jgi:hypothetical protein
VLAEAGDAVERAGAGAGVAGNRTLAVELGSMVAALTRSMVA